MTVEEYKAICDNTTDKDKELLLEQGSVYAPHEHGRWSIAVTTDLPPSETHYKCLACGKVAKVKRGSEIGLDYCGYCGAKMEVE